MEQDLLLTEQEEQLLSEKPPIKAVMVPPELLSWYNRITLGDIEAGIVKVLTVYRAMHEAERVAWL